MKKPAEPSPRTTFLSTANAVDAGIEEKWAASNEQWWDWYLSLAHDEDAHEDTASIAVAPLPDLPAPALSELEAELDAPYPLCDEAIEHFRRAGYVKLRDVSTPASLLALRREFDELFTRAVGQKAAMGFPSMELMWTVAPIARAFVLSRRLARIAAELLGVDAVRLYHDNALSKLPGCGRTPWHYDAHHYPIASENVVTVWFPLQPTPRSMGPLAFAEGIETWRRVADLAFDKFDDSYDREIQRVLRETGVRVEDGAFALGEASFHHARSLHTAGPNRTDQARMALATTYLEDGARMVDSPTLISGDYEKFMPGVEPGQAIASALNPVLYERPPA